MVETYYDVWRDQDSTFLQEHDVPLPKTQRLPAILVATLQAANVEEAWRQFRLLTPFEMPRFYDIWANGDGSIELSVRGPLPRPATDILRTFWAETAAQIDAEWKATLMGRGLWLDEMDDHYPIIEDRP